MTPKDRSNGVQLQAIPGGAKGRNVLDFGGKRAEKLMKQGLDSAAKGKVSEAIDFFRASAQAQPSSEAYTHWAWMTSFLGDFDTAIELCRAAIETDPSFGNPYNDIGSYYMKKGELDAAIPWLEQAKVATRYEPRHYPHLNLGRIYLSRCDFSRALAEFESALSYDPDNGELKHVVERIRARFSYSS